MVLPRICKRRGFLRRFLTFIGFLIFVGLLLMHMNSRKLTLNSRIKSLLHLATPRTKLGTLSTSQLKNDSVTSVTEKLSVTEKPSVTEMPSVTEKPSVTENPSVTEKPSVAEKPSLTEKPSVTSVTKKPSVTSMTKKPSVTSVTEKPSVTSVTKAIPTTPTKKKDEDLQGKLNLDIWINICSLNINSLRRFPLFPHFPNQRKYLSIQDTVQFEIMDQQFAIRIMGYIHPPKTGFYTFLLRTSALAQLWLSTSGANNTEKIAYTTHNLVENRGFDLGDHKPISNSVHLDGGQKYYFEILLVVSDLPQPASISLLWMVPGTTYFTKINGSQVSKYFSLPFAYKTPDINVAAVTDQLLPSVVYSEEEDMLTSRLFPLDKARSAKMKTIFTLNQPDIRNIIATHLDGGLEYDRITARSLPYMEIFGNDVINALFPKCKYDAGYIKFKEIKRYNGVWNTFFPKIFPADGSDLESFVAVKGFDDEGNMRGNDVMHENEALVVVNTFMDALNKDSQREFTLNSIINVEKADQDKVKGDRFFLELVLRRRHDNRLYRVSEFFYRNTGQTQLCLLDNFHWNPKVWVNVILNVKNQAGWVLYFVKEMSRILKETRDEYVNFVIADYGNEGIDIEKEMTRHGIKNFTIIKKSGSFYKTSTINMAASKVKDPRSIVLLMDLHLRFSSSLFDAVRKHTIQGKMAFCPVLMRLVRCGRPQTKHLYAQGFYERMGFGIFSIYKSDWDNFGGMNEEEFKNKWGGEDWEMVDRVLMKGIEIEKLRLPGFYHFYHDKKGMWNT